MSSSRATDTRRLDVASVAVAGAEFAGEWPQESLPRLASGVLFETPAAAPPVAFLVRGERAELEGAGVQAALRLHVKTEVRLECQRCLQPMTQPLRIDRRFFFVPGEAAAEALDADSEDDVLALTPALDLQALVEDELLLALPIVPRHDVCPDPLRLAADDDGVAEPEDHPFAALAALRLRDTPPS